jgi:hypothetical protein
MIWRTSCLQWICADARTVLLFFASLLALLAAVLLSPPVYQDPEYHNFADKQIIFGVPHFWNVISNAGFLVVAALGFAPFRSGAGFLQHWERIAYGTRLVPTCNS